MRSKFVDWRACSVAVVLVAATVLAADAQTASLVGATRAQVLERLGEPRSSIVAGPREVLLFARERVVLRNNVVVEVDVIASEPVRPPPSPDPTTENAGEGEPTEAPPADEAESASDARDARSNVVAPAPDNAPLEIRSVRPAGSSGPRPAPKAEAPATAPAPTTVAPSQSTTVSATPPPPKAAEPAARRDAGNAVSPTTAAAPATGAVAPTAPAAVQAVEKAEGASVAPAVTAAEPAPETPAPSSTEPAAAAPAEVSAPKASAEKSAVAPPAPALELEEPPLFTAQSYLIAFVIVAGGIGYLVWRARQRKLELAATAVSRTPFSSPAPATAGARFTPELLAKLEWKRFEQLVAAYYGKTGVVATRTNSGPSTAVHIKISWKGETRPFAYVQCLAHPAGLVDAKPIQELVATLMADDIRRGYVVTTGKFNVTARDFAEEKSITLLPGDIFLEKLNALPDGARNELMQEAATGDYGTPSCPRCDGKMVRAPDDPALWRCPTHPDVVIPAWK